MKQESRDFSHVRFNDNTRSFITNVSNEDGVRILGTWFEESSVLYFVDGEGLYQYSVQDSKEILLASLELGNDHRIFFDGQYAYIQRHDDSSGISGKLSLNIYSYDLSLVDRVEIDDGLDIFAITDEYVFLTMEGTYTPVYLIEKALIGTGELSLILVSSHRGDAADIAVTELVR